MFIPAHKPGEQGIAGFTWVRETVTIAGSALPHKLFHYRLVASGWAESPFPSFISLEMRLWHRSSFQIGAKHNIAVG